jgi:hypothetical protein
VIVTLPSGKTQILLLKNDEWQKRHVEIGKIPSPVEDQELLAIQGVLTTLPSPKWLVVLLLVREPLVPLAGLRFLVAGLQGRLVLELQGLVVELQAQLIRTQVLRVRRTELETLVPAFGKFLCFPMPSVEYQNGD